MLLKYLKPPRSAFTMLAWFPVKIGPDGKAPELTPEQNAYVAEQARKANQAFQRKRMLYWSIVGFAILLAALALYRLVR